MKSPLKKLISLISIVLILIQTLVAPFFALPAYAATSPWKQTDWSGGSGASTTNQYSALSNTDATTTAGQVTLAPVNELTNGTFASDNSSWSTAAVPASGWVEVPGNGTYSTTNFLAMQYEAKYDCTGDDDGDTAATCSAPADSGSGLDYRDIGSFDTANVVSTANGAPIVHISQTQAISACPAGYHLITNNEWMTIARNIEAQATNWANGVVGSTVSSGGGLKRGNIGIVDSASYNGADPEQGTGRDTKAKHVLSNGSEFWDISGNVWERNSDTITGANQPDVSGQNGFNWRDYTALTGYGSLSYDLLRPAGTTYNADHGVGRIYHDSNSVSSTVYSFTRGGYWGSNANAGVFTLDLIDAPSSQGYPVGFRCASDPVAISQSFSSSSGRSAGGGNTITIGSITDGKLYQSVNVGDTATYNLSAYVYDNTSGSEGGTVDATVASLYYGGNAITGATYTPVAGETGWYKLTGTVTGVASAVDTGIVVETSKSVIVDDVSLYQYFSSGTLTSNVFDTGQGSNWESLTYTANTPTNTSASVKVRSGNSSDLSDATAFSSCTTISSGVDMSANSCMTDTNRYVQYQVTLSTTDTTATPTFSDITIPFEVSDATAPSISLAALSLDPTTDTTPTLSGTATETIGTVSSVEFQMDSTAGSWNSCTADDETFDEASEAFTCTVASALSDGSHTMYVRATDSNGNTTASGSESSDSFTVDTTPPLSFDLQEPGSNAYINNDRPTFKWKGTSDSTSNLSKYVLEVDNGSSGDFTIDDIPVSRTSDYETNKYVIRYENFGDSDTTNNYISVWTKSSADWGTDHNDGKLKEGKRNWTIKVRDNAGNERSEGRTVFVDRNGPSLKLTQINETEFSSNNFSTTDKTPTISGKITDALSGDSSSTDEQVRNDNRVVSGPKSVEVKLEKKNVDGTYILDTITNIMLNETYWTSDGTKIADNSQQKSDTYSTFEFTPSVALSLGTYRLTLTGKDNAGNSGGETTLTLTVGTFAQLATPQEQEIVNQEIEKQLPGATEKQKVSVQKELEITKPEKPIANAQPASPSFFSRLGSSISRFFGNVGTYFTQVGQQGSRAFAEGTRQPRELANNLSEWVSYSYTSFGELVLDDKPTQIVDVNIENLTPTSVVVTWKTNHLATSKVNYGTTEVFGEDVQTSKKVHDHRLEITGLEPGTLYYFEVMSQNKNYVYDANHKFTTPEDENSK
ncbi:MAG: Ig-like domain-containing protein [Patescibacteria group bacterium]